MSKLQEAQAAEKALMLQTYDRYPRLFVSGRGVHLIDEDGDEHLDLLSGIGVSALGYGHPGMTRVLNEQGPKLIHTSNLFYNEFTAPLALRLTEASGMDRAFFCNSGTEAWEAALKLARAHALRLRAEGRSLGTRMIALEHSFHGRTIGSVATTHKTAYREPYAPVMPGVEFVPFNDVDALRAAFSDDFCTILIEPVQGEGGIHMVSREFFETARELCDSTGALLVADEIQCGFGRTGKWFAYQHLGIQPDVTTIAKPMAGGLPMGALLCTEEAAKAITPGMHGTTFGGGPLACAMATAVFDTIVSDGILDQVTQVGGYFKLQLEWLRSQHSAIVDVRGMGLMLGMEVASGELAKQILGEMMDQNIILNRTSETVLRFLPPYILEKSHVDHAISVLHELFTLHETAEPAHLAAEENLHG